MIQQQNCYNIISASHMQMEHFNPAENASDMGHPGEGEYRAAGARKKGTPSSATVPCSGAATDLDRHAQNHSSVVPELVQGGQISSSTEQNISLTRTLEYNSSAPRMEPTRTSSIVGVPVVSKEARRRIKDEERRERKRQQWSWWPTNLLCWLWWMVRWRWCTCYGIVACCVAILAIALALSSVSRAYDPPTSSQPQPQPPLDSSASTLGELVGRPARATTPSLEEATRLRFVWVMGNASAFSNRASTACLCSHEQIFAQAQVMPWSASIRGYCEAPLVDRTGPRLEKKNNAYLLGQWHYGRVQMAQAQVREILTDADAGSVRIATEDLAEGMRELTWFFEQETESTRMMRRRQGVQAIQEEEEPGSTTRANTQSNQSRGQERRADLVWLRRIIRTVHTLLFSRPPARGELPPLHHQMSSASLRQETATEVIRLTEVALKLHYDRLKRLSHALQDLTEAVDFSANKAGLIEREMELWDRTLRSRRGSQESGGSRTTEKKSLEDDKNVHIDDDNDDDGGGGYGGFRVRQSPADLKNLFFMVQRQGQNVALSTSSVQEDVDKTRDQLKVWMEQVHKWKQLVKTAVTESDKVGKFHAGGAPPPLQVVAAGERGLSTEDWLWLVKGAAQLLPELSASVRAYVV